MAPTPQSTQKRVYHVLFWTCSYFLDLMSALLHPSARVHCLDARWQGGHANATSRTAPRCSAAEPSLQHDHGIRILGDVKVVLVSPRVPANIGATLRAAAVYEAGEVYVVDPRCQPNDAAIAVVACDAPMRLHVVPSLRDALADTQLSIAFTRRAGGGRATHPSNRALLSRFPLDPLALAGPSSSFSDLATEHHPVRTTALVFGREESGLLDEEVLLCSHACAIPTGRAFPSLNLSHAVAVALSQLFDATVAAGGGAESLTAGRVQYHRARAETAAPHAEIDALLRRAAALLTAAGISTEESSGGGDKGNHGRRRKPLGHLRQVLTRSQANVAEVRAMHGLLKEVEALRRAAE